MDGGPDADADWYVDGVRQFLAAVRRWLEERSGSRLPRRQPLVALPLVGTDDGDGAGAVVEALLPELLDQARGAPFDLALVAPDAASHAAAQSVRRRQGDAWRELRQPLRTQAEELAARAACGEVALFLGAGVSASAGL